MSQEREHTRFSPSRSEQFFLCPGAPNLLARTPARPSTSYADEGILAHTILEAGLNNRCTNATQAIIAADYDCIIDSYFDNVVKLNDFKASINDALDYVWNLLDELNKLYGDAQMFVEVRVNPPINSAPGEAAGYCDIAIYSAKARALWVIDYKHGAGITKAVLGNTQIKQYAAGFVYDPASPIANAVDTVEHVTMVIIQPRAFHPHGDIREYTTTPLELADYLMDLDTQIEECLKPDAPLVPGLEQCRFCDAASTCPARERAALAVVSQQFASVRDIKAPNMPAPETMDVARLGYIFQHKDMLVKWLGDVTKHIYQLQMDGVLVPGTKLVEAEAKRHWFGEEEERAVKLAALIGCKPDDLYRKSFQTITEAEDMVVRAFKNNVARNRKKQAAEDAKKMFAYFTTKESSGNLTVVTDDDPRPPANRALKSFTQLAGLIPPSNTGDRNT